MYLFCKQYFKKYWGIAMKKRIFLTIFVFIMLCLTVQAAKKYDEERGNDKVHIAAARQISALDGVDGAAVLSREGRVLAGVTLLTDADGEYINEKAGEILKKAFPKAEEFSLFTGDANARKVVELSLCLDTDMKKKLLKQRFDFLMEQEGD